MSWTDPASLGYPALFGGVLLGSIIPIVPTGAVVGAGAAVAMTTDHLNLPLVILLSALGAFAGDVVTFAVPRFGSEAALRWVTRHQKAESPCWWPPVHSATRGDGCSRRPPPRA
jgi:membrane protein DedA with SNARE-associated domain